MSKSQEWLRTAYKHPRHRNQGKKASQSSGQVPTKRGLAKRALRPDPVAAGLTVKLSEFIKVDFMADSFLPVFEGMKRAAEGMIMAHDGMKMANEGLISAVNAAIAASNEHEDLKETVDRLEVLILQQGRDIRELRDQLGGNEK